MAGQLGMLVYGLPNNTEGSSIAAYEPAIHFYMDYRCLYTF